MCDHPIVLVSGDLGNGVSLVPHCHMACLLPTVGVGPTACRKVPTTAEAVPGVPIYAGIFHGVGGGFVVWDLHLLVPHFRMACLLPTVGVGLTACRRVPTMAEAVPGVLIYAGIVHGVGGGFVVWDLHFGASLFV